MRPDQQVTSLDSYEVDFFLDGLALIMDSSGVISAEDWNRCYTLAKEEA